MSAFLYGFERRVIFISEADITHFPEIFLSLYFNCDFYKLLQTLENLFAIYGGIIEALLCSLFILRGVAFSPQKPYIFPPQKML